VQLAQDEDKIYWVVLVIIWAKVLIETLRMNFGYQSFVGDMIVISEAHLIGVFYGTVSAFIWKNKISAETA